MLQTIRSKTHGTIAWVVIILIGFVFAIWGIEGYISSDSNQIARVNGEVITDQDFQRTYQHVMRQQQMAAMMQGQPAAVNDQQIRDQALNGLVNEKLLTTVAHKQGFAIGKDQVDNLLRTLPQFQENGEYVPAKLEAAVTSMGYSTLDFRQAVQNDLMIGQARGAIVDSSFVLPYELDKAIALLEQTRDIKYLMIPAAEYMAEANVSDADIRAYYDAHSADFMLPERMTVQSIRVNGRDYTIDTPDDQTLQTYYDAHSAVYTEPEKRHAMHILLTTEKSGGDEASLNALAEKLMQELRQGADFATLAKEYSADPGSTENGGDLGWFGKGAMVPEFDEAVFKAQAGDLVGPVKTQFGLHIIKVVEVQPGQLRPFADVKDQVIKDWTKAQRETRFASDLAQLETLTFENPDSLEPAAKALNLEIKESKEFSRDNSKGLGELNKPEAVQAAFSDAVFLDGHNSAVISYGPIDAAVLRKLTYEEPRLEDYDTVKDSIKQKLALEQATKKAHANSETWLAAIQQGTAPDQIDHGKLTWVPAALSTRYNMAVPPEVLDAAFALHVPAEKTGNVASVVAIGDNDYAVVVVDAVHDGKLDPKFGDEMRAEYLQGLIMFKGELDYQLYVAQARKDSEIEIKEKL